MIETPELNRIEADTSGASIESSAQFVPLAFTNIYRSERRRSSGRQIARTREGGTPHSDNNRQESISGETESLSQDPSSFYPHARSLADLVTARQLGMISLLGKRTGLDIDLECDRTLGCKPHDLSKNAASAFIDHLERKQIGRIRRAS